MQKNFVLKAKNTIKRVAAISVSSAMLGATMIGAVAAQDLGDYPSPFISASIRELFPVFQPPYVVKL